MAMSVLRLGLRGLRGLSLRTARGSSALPADRITTVVPQDSLNVWDSRGPAQLLQRNGSQGFLVAVREYSKAPQPGRGRAAAESDSDSDSDSDNEGSRKSRGDSEFWRRKMRTFHGLLDLNKDGVVSFDDYKLLANRFVDLGHLSPSDTAEFQKSIQEMWEEQWGSVDPYNLVTTEQYLTEMHHTLNDRSLKKKAHRFLPFLFKAVDKDKSGEISVEEFKIFFQCLGLSELDATASFNVIDTNTDGRISLKEFVKLGKDFFLTEDARRPSKMFWGPLAP